MSVSQPLRPPVDVVQQLLASVEPGLARLDRTLTEMTESGDSILQPMLSSVFAGSGKRLRPALSLLIGKFGPADSELMNHMAVGVELLHTASLVHDDVVDESALRRGSPTLFTRIGNALAVLVGDYLFAQAAHHCVETGNLRVVRLFADTLRAMAQGQVDDGSAQKSSRTWATLTQDRYYTTVEGKTASLFVLACEGSAILAGLTEKQVDALRTYGLKLGLAFQVVDDILDFTSTENELGKPVGNDLRQGTITLPVIIMRDRQLADGQMTSAFESDDVAQQVRLVQESGAIEASYEEAQNLVNEACRALEVLPRGPERAALEDLAHYVMARRR